MTTENTSLNNNNNHSLNNNTIKYSNKSTQTTDCDECEKPTPTKDELITAETQTDFTNLHSESICCLSSIPYADMTNSPPPPPPVPYRRINTRKISENSNENHRDNNHVESNQLSVRNLQLAANDMSVGVTTQTAKATGADNGTIQSMQSDKLNGEHL